MEKFNCLNCQKESDDLDYLGYCTDCISFSLQREEELDNEAYLSYPSTTKTL